MYSSAGRDKFGLFLVTGSILFTYRRAFLSLMFENFGTAQAYHSSDPRLRLPTPMGLLRLGAASGWVRDSVMIDLMLAYNWSTLPIMLAYDWSTLPIIGRRFPLNRDGRQIIGAPINLERVGWLTGRRDSSSVRAMKVIPFDLQQPL